MSDKRAVKLGRKPLFPSPAFHWAVKVGDTWYEMDPDDEGKKSKRTRINSSRAYAAYSGAGSLGGKLAGETDKTDDEIEQWCEYWVHRHPNYGVLDDNCQKLAYEFMDWLTDGNFICPHKFDAADYKGNTRQRGINTFARAEDGNAIAKVSYRQRAVKLGRKQLYLSPAFHWAVKVGDTWYEMDPDDDGKKSKRTRINSSRGYAAYSGAGSLGGELAGETDKTDDEIEQWCEYWVHRHPNYGVLDDNCQKLAYEFMDWLTDGNFICPHKFDAAGYKGNTRQRGINTFARAEDGNAIAKVSYHHSTRLMGGGLFSLGSRLSEAKVQAVAGPGLGAWADVSLIRGEVSVGNIVGAHLDLNANTGVGVRNGNLDAHVLGFGARVGSDGLSIDTPVGGVSACSIM